jgi:aryl-alcohol dehydrogenase-like predicted oxidoreductase
VELRALGADAPAVPSVGYGGMHLSLHSRPTRSQALDVIRAALDAGVRLIDTADVYCLDDTDIGHNEVLVAEALRGWSGDRDAVLVATKGGLTRPGGRWERNGRPEHLRAACDRSLRALGVERIALYQLHAPDERVPFEESVGALAELRREGKIRWVGLSNVSVAEIRAAEAITPVVAVQNRLNPFFREAMEEGVVRYCARQKIGFLAYSPTGGARLTLKLPDHPVLHPMAARLGVTAHALVIAWALAQSPSVVVIPSARRVEHALDSVRAGELKLSTEDLEAIDGATFSRA